MRGMVTNGADVLLYAVATTLTSKGTAKKFKRWNQRVVMEPFGNASGFESTDSSYKEFIVLHESRLLQGW